MDSSTKKRAHIIFHGRVQGVGFRFTAERIARHLRVTGYVRNLPRGTVEMVCEGPEEEIESFIVSIRREMGTRIRDASIKWQPASGKFSSFSIKY